MSFSGSLLYGLTASPTDLQVRHDSWTFKDGAPEDVSSLAQTSDGFIWLGSPMGLYRFDGNRFEQFRSPYGDQLLSTKVLSLFAPASGGLWIGYASGGFSFMNQGRVINYGGETARSTRTCGGFAADRDGFIWAVTASGLWRFDHSDWKQIGAEWNIPPRILSEVGADDNGIIWVLAFGVGDKDTTLYYLLPGTNRFAAIDIRLPIEGFTVGPDGKVVTSAVNKRLIQGSRRIPDDSPGAFPVFGKNAFQIVDRTGSIWSVNFGQSGLKRLSGSETAHNSWLEGTSKNVETYHVDPNAYAKLIDREGNIWFGDRMGLHRFFYSPLVKQKIPGAQPQAGILNVAPEDDGSMWIMHAAPFPSGSVLYLVSGEGIQKRVSMADRSQFMYRAPDRTIWFDGAKAIWHLVNGKMERVDFPSELRDHLVGLRTMTQDGAGGLWVALREPGLYRVADGVWTPYGGRTDLPRSQVLTEFTDSLGRVWFGYGQNTLAVLDKNQLKVYRAGDGLAVGDITAIRGRGLGIWIGGDEGVQRFEDGQFQSIKAVDDDWLRGISGMVESANGDLWLNTLGGILHIQASELSSALRDSSHRVAGDHLGRREGYPGGSFLISRPNAAIEGTDGRLWFTGSNGLVWLDPSRLLSRMPPPVRIQSISADDKFFAPASSPKFPPRTSAVEITYSGVSLSDPEDVRFRYKLKEIDKDWHEVNSATSVSYRNLAPGSYHFSVGARGASAAWPATVATVEFTILPAFYQTRWFAIMCAIAILACVWLLLHLRVTHVAGLIRHRAEARADERVRIARDLHDTLLQGVQGLMLHFHVTAQELPEGSRTRMAMERALATADRIMTEGRDRVNRLRSDVFSTTDLAIALETIADDLNRDQRVSFDLNIEGRLENIVSAVSNELRYIGREAISNAFRHSDASEIVVRLMCEAKSVVLVVADNGHGFDSVAQDSNPRPGHWGLRGMKERAGVIGARFECHTSPNKGTEIMVTVPARRAYGRRRRGKQA